MKQKILSSLLSVLCIAILFTACKKNDDSGTPDADAQVVAHANDESQVSSDLDGISLDVSTVVEFDPVFSGNNSVLDEIVCDATVAYNKESDPMTITITYNGSNCGAGRARTGKVVLSMPKGQEWKNPGAAITLSFQQLKISRESKSITINGSQTFTNVSGGLLFQLPNLPEGIIHTITSGDMSVSFDNGTARNWNVAKKHAYTYNEGVVLTVTGTHTEGSDEGIIEWGSNRFGNSFRTITTSPLIIRQACSFRLTSGEVKHSTDAHTSIVTFGLDATGVAAICPGTGHYYYKLAWTGRNGNSLNLILPY